MKIQTVLSGYFKLDGGAMFGIVPKQMWSKLIESDEKNMCTWAMRSLLVRHLGRTILIDTGIGDKQGEKFRKHFEPHGEMTLLEGLAVHGVQPEDVTDVILTHLHFDHCGEAVSRVGEELVPTFPNATYYISRKQFESTLNPNEKERASFLQENYMPLQEHGVLELIETDGHIFSWEQPYAFMPGIEFYFAYGHTDCMIIPALHADDRTYIYAADLMPSSLHLGIPYVMAYDIHPLITLEEKVTLLSRCHEAGYALIYEHDPKLMASTIAINDRKKYAVDEILSF